MAQEKGNVSPKLRKRGFFAQILVIFSQNSLFDEIQFSQKSLINRKNGPHEKETKILKEGARGDIGSPEQNESPIPDLSNAF